MKLKDCTIGKVVCQRDTTVGDNFGKPKKSSTSKILPSTNKEVVYTKVGHIVGLDLNSLGETNVIVLWNDFTKLAYHPNNLLECED